MTKMAKGGPSKIRLPRVATALAVLAALELAMVSTPSAKAQSFSVLHRFTGFGDNCPRAPLIMDPEGNLYGTTSGVCPFFSGEFAGTVFQLDPVTGIYTVLHSVFADPADGATVAGLIMDPAGNLYGTTAGGGAFTYFGTVFQLDRARKYRVVYSFSGPPSDGSRPAAALIMDQMGNLYGTTAEGGTGGCAPQGCGTVFQLDPAGNETLLYSFNGPDGAYPQAALIMDPAGNLYGTTWGGGFGVGTVFQLDPAGNETVLHSFNGSAYPQAPLIMDPAGNLYGTTSGGPNGTGNVFKIDQERNYTVLYSFTGGSDGRQPWGVLIMDEAGNLYGTTAFGGTLTCPAYGGIFGCGTVFKLDPAGNETVLHTFTGDDGAYPIASLIMDPAGNLYGTTSGGGDLHCYGGCGTVFTINLTPDTNGSNRANVTVRRQR